MRPYVLLTPGPLTTTDSVKQTMMADWCTWDEDYNVHIVEEIRKVARHLRPVGNDGEGARQVALHLAHPRGARLQAGHAGAEGRGRDRGTPSPLLPEPRRAGAGHALAGLPHVVARRGAVARHYLLPLSARRVRLQVVLRPAERAWLCHLPGQDIAGRYLPHRQHRRCASCRLHPAHRRHQGLQVLT